MWPGTQRLEEVFTPLELYCHVTTNYILRETPTQLQLPPPHAVLTD